jgi:hypothetical protein
LWRQGLIATTNAGGAGKWCDEYARQLVTIGAKSVVILPDNDDPGRKHADHVAKSCRDAGLLATKVELPGLPVKGDVSDWLRHRSIEDLIAAVSERPAEVGVAFVADGSLAAVLDDIEAFVRRYVVLSPEAAVLTSIWIAHTHGIDAAEYTPYINVKSPMPECGKTRYLEVLEALVANPWLTGRVTPAVLTRIGHESSGKTDGGPGSFPPPVQRCGAAFYARMQ